MGFTMGTGLQQVSGICSKSSMACAPSRPNPVTSPPSSMPMTSFPPASVAERWQTTASVTGDYARDRAELAREALSHVGFTHFEETPYADVLACREGDLPVTVAIMAIPAEAFGMTIGDLESLIDDVRAHGAALCIGRALLGGGELPERLRFDVVSVCMSATELRVRVHHVRGAWQS